VRHRWRLVLAILIYVTLDLSLAEMPGAFVFEPGDSVESVQGSGSRARAAADVAVLPPEAGSRLVVSRPPAEHTRRLARAARVELRWHSVRPRPSLAHVDSASQSEDPH
jgi:hypothetical protein